MPEIALHARALPVGTPAGTIRLWVGVTDQSIPPQLNFAFFLGGVPINTQANPTYGPAPAKQTARPCIYTAIYEFTGFTPGVDYEVICNLNGAPGTVARLKTRCMRAEIPNHAWFNILMVSCFHYSEASPLIHQTIREARRHLIAEANGSDIDLGLFMGDQVYLDLPTFADFRSDQNWLEDEFEADYQRNFFGSAPNVHGRVESRTYYPSALQAAPCAFIPDDHEYWNNFPCTQAHIGNTHSYQRRANWGRAAKNMLRAFTAHDPTNIGSALRIDVEPLSLFLADSRTHRGWAFQSDEEGDADPFENAFHTQTLTELENWVQDANSNNRFGIFATGQSLLDPPAGWLARRFGDAQLSNHKDYKRLIATLIGDARSERRGLKLTGMLLTGDVHWGRWCVFHDANYDRLHELIVSPLSLVEAPSMHLGEFPFTRHGSASTPPPKPKSRWTDASRWMVARDFRLSIAAIISVSFRFVASLMRCGFACATTQCIRTQAI